MGKLRSARKSKLYDRIRQLHWGENSSLESDSSESFDDLKYYTTRNKNNFSDWEQHTTDHSDDPYVDIKLEDSYSVKIGSVLEEARQMRGYKFFDLKKSVFSDSNCGEESSTVQSVDEMASDTLSTVSREPLFPGLPPLPRPTPKAPPPSPTNMPWTIRGESAVEDLFGRRPATYSTLGFSISHPTNSSNCTFGKRPFLHLKYISPLSVTQRKDPANNGATSKRNNIPLNTHQLPECKLTATADKIAAEKEVSISHLIDKLKSRQNLAHELGRGNIPRKITNLNVIEGRKHKEEHDVRPGGVPRAEPHLKAKEVADSPPKLVVRTAPALGGWPQRPSRLQRPITYSRLRRRTNDERDEKI